MRVTSLHLYNFRNYPRLEVRFAAGPNLFVGRNAEGKTNILEALFFLATTRSHRTSHDQELITWGQESLVARAVLQRAAGPSTVELQLQERRKRARLNGAAQNRLLDFVGQLKAVLFSPEDLQLLKGSPQLRRRFLDLQLGQTSRPYLHHLQEYTRSLSHRNALLRREPAPTAGELEVWDEQLAQHGAQLLARRADAVEALREQAVHYHREVTSGREELQVSYQPGLPGWQPAAEEGAAARHLAAELLRRRRQDLARRTTLVGPHRDDIALHLNGRDARLYASQGQQRSAVLALKLAELHYITRVSGEPPVLLLDDVTSELDLERRRFLLQVVPSAAQLFMTATETTDLDPGWLRGANVFGVQAGRLFEMPPGNN